VQEKAVAVARVVVVVKAAVVADVAKVMLEDGQARREAHLEAEDPTHLVGANNSAKKSRRRQRCRLRFFHNPRDLRCVTTRNFVAIR